MRSVKPGEALCASAIAQYRCPEKNFAMQTILEFDRLLKHSAISIVPQQNGEGVDSLMRQVAGVEVVLVT